MTEQNTQGNKNMTWNEKKFIVSIVALIIIPISIGIYQLIQTRANTAIEEKKLNHEMRKDILDRVLDEKQSLPYRRGVVTLFIRTLPEKDPNKEWATSLEKIFNESIAGVENANTEIEKNKKIVLSAREKINKTIKDLNNIGNKNEIFNIASLIGEAQTKIIDLEKQKKSYEKVIIPENKEIGKRRTKKETEDSYTTTLNFKWPTSGTVIEKYGAHEAYGMKTFRNGIRIQSTDNKVYATLDGKVVYNDFLGYYQLIIIKHNKEFSSFYGLKKAYVSIGDTVKQGDIIGELETDSRASNSGILYFEIRKDQKPINPQELLLIEAGAGG